MFQLMWPTLYYLNRNSKNGNDAYQIHMYSHPFLVFFSRELMVKYDVAGIPTLVVVDKSGQLISLNGRKEVTDKGPKAFQHWLQTLHSAKKSSVKSWMLNKNGISNMYLKKYLNFRAEKIKIWIFTPKFYEIYLKCNKKSNFSPKLSQ